RSPYTLDSRSGGLQGSCKLTLLEDRRPIRKESGSRRVPEEVELPRDGAHGSDGPGGLAPDLPVSVETLAEVFRRFPEDPSAERDRLALQSLVASIDPVQEGFDDFRTTKSLRVTGYLAPQHGQIMVVTEDISELFRSLRQRSEDTGLHRPQQLQ